VPDKKRAEGKIIELRGHHLGPIYEVVALIKVHQCSAEDAISEFCRLCMNYPAETRSMARRTLGYVFLSQNAIRVVRGLDIICNAGCLKQREESVYSEGMARDSKRGLIRTLGELCKNTLAKEDIAMLKIFGLEIGGVYPSVEIIDIAEKLYVKIGDISWWLLMGRFPDA